MKKRYAGLAALVAVALLVTAGGCMADGSGKAAGDRTFVYAAVGAPSTLDLWTTYEGDTSRVNGYEWGSTLIKYGEAPDSCETLLSSENLRGNLAESWEYAPDSKQWVINLRPEAKSAAGNPLTAEDVVWSLDRAREVSVIVQYLMYTVADFNEKKPFEVKDEHTVAVNVASQTALDMAIFTWTQMSVLDSVEIKKHTTSEDPLGNEWLKTNVATFGPWQLESFTPGSELVYTVNPNFWNSDRGNFDKLVYRAVPDATTRLQLLESGEVDYAERLTFEQYQGVVDSPSLQLVDCVSPTRDTLMLNEEYAPFADQRVRQAISQAIDREALVEGVYRGLAKPAVTGISDVYWEPGTDNQTFTYDPDNAKRLLADAGAEGLTFTMLASPTKPGAHAQSMAIQIQSMLKEVGVTAEIRMVPGATEFSENYFEGDYEAMIYVEQPVLGDPFYSANLNNASDSFQNTFGYHNSEYDALTKEIRVTEPGPARDELISKLSDVTVETVPSVYLTDNQAVHAMSGDIEGYQNNPGGSLRVYWWNTEG